MKKHKAPAAAPEPEFKVNPFSKLKLAPAAEPAPEPARKTGPAPAPGAAKPGPLSREDEKLRAALERNAAGLLVKLRFNKRGRGGQETTLVRGLVFADIAGMMEFSAVLERELALRGTWFEQEFEIPGNQVQRLVPWLQQHGYRPMVL